MLCEKWRGKKGEGGHSFGFHHFQSSQAAAAFPAAHQPQWEAWAIDQPPQHPPLPLPLCCILSALNALAKSHIKPAMPAKLLGHDAPHYYSVQPVKVVARSSQADICSLPA